MNGHSPSHSSVPPAGIWAPAITFFDPETDELDLISQAKYYKYLAQHLTGLVILGTNAETFMLTRDERAVLLKTARDAVGPDFPIMVRMLVLPNHHITASNSRVSTHRLA